MTKKLAITFLHFHWIFSFTQNLQSMQHRFTCTVLKLERCAIFRKKNYDSLERIFKNWKFTGYLDKRQILTQNYINDHLISECFIHSQTFIHIQILRILYPIRIGWFSLKWKFISNRTGEQARTNGRTIADSKYSIETYVYSILHTLQKIDMNNQINFSSLLEAGFDE